MPEHQPATLPPGQRAEDAAVVVHRGRHVGRDETEIDRRRHEQQLGQAQAEHTQDRKEKPDAPAATAQLTGAGPMVRLRNVFWHVSDSRAKGGRGNDECRMSNVEGSPNDERGGCCTSKLAGHGLRVSDFGILSSFVIRHWTFLQVYTPPLILSTAPVI